MALVVGGTTVTGTQTLDATRLTGNLPAISGASLTGISAGITVAGQFRITSNQAGDQDPLNAWEENDTNYRFKKDRWKFQSQCKDCLHTMQQVKRRDMSEEEKTQRSEWSLNFYYKNREAILEKRKEYNIKNKKIINARWRGYTKAKALDKIKQLRNKQWLN